MSAWLEAFWPAPVLWNWSEQTTTSWPSAMQSNSDSYASMSWLDTGSVPEGAASSICLYTLTKSEKLACAAGCQASKPSNASASDASTRRIAEAEVMALTAAGSPAAARRSP